MIPKKTTNRRQFIATSLKGSLAVSAGLGIAAPLLQSFSPNDNDEAGFNTRFNQQPLPYKYDALENVIDTMTMEIHYSKHAAAYCKNLNDAVAELPDDFGADFTVEKILSQISKFNSKMRNNGGGHYNHEMFWQCMRARKEGNVPTGKLMEAITKSFSSFNEFKKQFTDAGKNRFGSGWAWLYLDKDKNLKIGSTPNQDNPLMDVSDVKGFPLLALDVWEHAYYLKYQNKRADYIDNWWQVVNWDYVAERLHSYNM